LEIGLRFAPLERLEPVFCDFEPGFSRNLKSDNEMKSDFKARRFPISKTQKKEVEKKPRSHTSDRERKESKDLWSDSCGARRPRG